MHFGEQRSIQTVRVGMGRMTDDAFNLELPSVGCAQQTQKTSPQQNKIKIRNAVLLQLEFITNTIRIHNKEALIKKQKWNIIYTGLGKTYHGVKPWCFLVFRLSCLKLHWACPSCCQALPAALSPLSVPQSLADIPWSILSPCPAQSAWLASASSPKVSPVCPSTPRKWLHLNHFNTSPTGKSAVVFQF